MIKTESGELIADLSAFTDGSIRDFPEFREDLQRLSAPGLAKAQAKIIRKEIYDVIDARVSNAIKAARLAATTQASTAQAERDAALEEAALLCEQIGTDWLDADDAHKQFAADHLAKAIRAIRSAGDTGGGE